MANKNGKPRTERTTAVQLTKDEQQLVTILRQHKGKAAREATQFQAYLEITKDPTAAAVLMLRDTMRLVAEGQGMQISELFDEVEVLEHRR